MTITRACYTTRETVADALDIRLTARMHRRIDKAIEAATNDVNKLCHRSFTPWLGSRSFDWPDPGSPTRWRLWLDNNELIRLDTITVSGVTLDPSRIVRYPNTGPPYNRLETDRAGIGAFTAPFTSSSQQTLVIGGLFGYRDDQQAAGSLTADLAADATTLPVSDAVTIGTGDLLTLGVERLLVVGRRTITTGQTLTADLASSTAATLVSVDDPDAFTPDEIITIDAERLRIDDTTADGLIVRRAFDGSTLAAHTAGTTLYAGRSLQVVRGQAGTIAAAHNTGTVISRHVPPSLASRYTQAAAEVTVLQELAGYARTVGSGDAERQASGAQVAQLREDLYGALARKNRARAVR